MQNACYYLDFADIKVFVVGDSSLKNNYFTNDCCITSNFFSSSFTSGLLAQLSNGDSLI